MKRILSYVLPIAFLLSFPLWAQEGVRQAQSKFRKVQPGTAVADQYLVALRSDLIAPDVRSIAQTMASSRRGTVLHVYERAFKGFAVRMSEAEAIALSNNPQVEAVQEDAIVTAHDVQSPAPWGLDRIDRKMLALDNSYTYNYRGVGVNAYVLDSGIKENLAEFLNDVGSSRATRAFDAIDDDNNTATDTNSDNLSDGDPAKDAVDCAFARGVGHGTAVAAVLGGKTYGVAKRVKIFAVKVLECRGLTGTISGIIAGVEWVIANHVKPAVANFSLGGPPNDFIDRAVRNLIAAGVSCVVSAPNDQIDASQESPGRVAGCLTVGSTDRFDTNQSRGFGPTIDLFAPGEGIPTIDLQNLPTFESGTSVAAPHVSGVVALYLQRFPLAAPSEIANAITTNAAADKVMNAGPGSTRKILFSLFF